MTSARVSSQQALPAASFTHHHRHLSQSNDRAQNGSGALAGNPHKKIMTLGEKQQKRSAYAPAPP